MVVDAVSGQPISARIPSFRENNSEKIKSWSPGRYVEVVWSGRRSTLMGSRPKQSMPEQGMEQGRHQGNGILFSES